MAKGININNLPEYLTEGSEITITDNNTGEQRPAKVIEVKETEIGEFHIILSTRIKSLTPEEEADEFDQSRFQV